MAVIGDRIFNSNIGVKGVREKHNTVQYGNVEEIRKFYVYR